MGFRFQNIQRQQTTKVNIIISCMNTTYLGYKFKHKNLPTKSCDRLQRCFIGGLVNKHSGVSIRWSVDNNRIQFNVICFHSPPMLTIHHPIKISLKGFRRLHTFKGMSSSYMTGFSKKCKLNLNTEEN